MSETQHIPNLSIVATDIEPLRPISVSDVLFMQGKPTFTIGSDVRSHLRLADPEVAPAHAVISFKDGAFWIANRFSRYEVQVNGKPLKRPAPLSDGDVILLGGYTLRVQLQPFAQLAESTTTATPERIIVPTADASRQSLATQVYYPRQASSERSSMGRLALILALIGAVIGVGGYTLYTRVIQPANDAPPPLVNPFFYNDGNVTILQFDATWCGQCKIQQPLLQSVATEFRGSVYLNTADVDNPGNEFLIRAFQVSSIPTVIILNDQGQAIATLDNSADFLTVRQAVLQALSSSKGSPALASASR